MKARIRVIQGSTAAGKTHGIIPILINEAMLVPRQKITVVAETIPAVKDGCVDIFKQVMWETNRWIDANWISNPMQYTFGNGTRIQFTAYENEGKARSAGKRDMLFLNEANNIQFPIADALMIRSKQTYIDFNPTEEFWAHTEVLGQPNAEFLSLTYLDNEAIPPETLEDMLIKRAKGFYDVKGDLNDKKNIKSNYWANWWKVYGLGQIGNLMGAIFDNWGQIDELPKEAKLLAYGADWGFTNDPTTLTGIYKWNGQYIFHEIVYQKGLVNSEIANLFKSNEVDKYVTIYADSAEPKTIQDISNYGYRIKGADKGKDSVMFGISLMQENRFLVTKQSINLIKELRSYTWDTDKTGHKVNKPIDAFNHCIDGIRYYFTSQNKSSGKYALR